MTSIAARVKTSRSEAGKKRAKAEVARAAAGIETRRGGEFCVPRGRRASFAAGRDGCAKKDDLVDREARVNKTSECKK
jgi:hypothetical protein